MNYFEEKRIIEMAKELKNKGCFTKKDFIIVNQNYFTWSEFQKEVPIQKIVVQTEEKELAISEVLQILNSERQANKEYIQTKGIIYERTVETFYIIKDIPTKNSNNKYLFKINIYDIHKKLRETLKLLKEDKNIPSFTEEEIITLYLFYSWGCYDDFKFSDFLSICYESGLDGADLDAIYKKGYIIQDIFENDYFQWCDYQKEK